MIIKLLDHCKVHYDPNKKKSCKGELLIGLGDTQAGNKGVVLQHKTESVRYDSLSHYMYTKEFSGIKTENCCSDIYLEDYSVDTMLSLWIFLQKIAKHSLPDNVLDWIDYASRWEKGDTCSTGKPFESYGCLQNALALHLKSESPRENLIASITFLDYLIAQSVDPAYIPDNINVISYTEAKYVLKKEQDKYEDIVSKSEIEILFIPKKSSGNVKVSAIFIETNIVSSIQKVFLRNDENSPTRDGYALMAVCNSFAKGTGNDIVISVDPAKEVYLESLWKLLEKEEERLWEGKRANDTPRSLVSYPHNNGPNQPWWDDMGNYTLIAAPKMVGNEYGRRVSWKTVKQLIKQLYAKGAQL